MTPNILHLYVNIPTKSPNFNTIAKALLYASNHMPTELIGEKEYPAPTEDITSVVIHIGSGIYREKLTITRPYITLEGDGQDNTILTYGDYANETMLDGSKRGTFRTASVRIDTHDFTARNLTFQNDSGYGHTVGQALALFVDGDRILLENCRLLGSQDTLFTAPLPPKEAQPNGFLGPSQFAPRVMGRHCYRNCYIQGDVDFIFGGAIAYFEDCIIFSQKPGDRKPPESPSDEVIYGYITAASTPENETYGYVFKDCQLISDCPPHTVYLGRPWREFAKTVFIHCELGEHIHPLGWNDWNKPHGQFYYGEYDSYGAGASPNTRADFSHQLSEEEANTYTSENILNGWIPA